MTHKKLRKLEYSNLQAAIDHPGAAPLAFLLEVISDEQYSRRLRIEACGFALPIMYGPPPGGPIESEAAPRLAEFLSELNADVSQH
jgi:hypothetical protein